MIESELRALLPKHKSEMEKAKAIVALGYPAVAPVLRDLLVWVQDANWPISGTISKFLASVGEPMFSLLREVFEGNDGTWKYWCIGDIVMDFPRATAEQLRPELQRLAFHPSSADEEEGADERARDALEWLNAENEGRG